MTVCYLFLTEFMCTIMMTMVNQISSIIQFLVLRYSLVITSKHGLSHKVMDVQMEYCKSTNSSCQKYFVQHNMPLHEKTMHNVLDINLRYWL